MIIDDKQQIIKFNGLIFYKIQQNWWKISEEKEEIFNTGSRNIVSIVPVIERKITFKEIKKYYLRIEKLKRIIEDEED